MEKQFYNVQETPQLHTSEFQETERPRPFKCEICENEHFITKTFLARKDLNRHIAAVHEGKKPFKCKICNFEFSLKGNLNKHISSVHEKQRPFKCEICDSTFKHKQSLDRHFITFHEGEQPTVIEKEAQEI